MQTHHDKTPHHCKNYNYTQFCTAGSDQILAEKVYRHWATSLNQSSNTSDSCMSTSMLLRSGTQSLKHLIFSGTNSWKGFRPTPKSLQIWSILSSFMKPRSLRAASLDPLRSNYMVLVRG